MRVATISAASALVIAGCIFIAGASGGSQSVSAGAKTRTLPTWAYPAVPTPMISVAKPTAIDAGGLKHVDGSSVGYTQGYIKDLFTVPDWFPESHGPMPEVVSHGRRPEVYACGYCHLPNGLGRPENASLAGLPEAYMIAQMEAFKKGTRKSSEPRMMSVNYMIQIAKASSPEEIKGAAAYFAHLKRAPWIDVVEADAVPKTRIAGMMLVPAEEGGMEPIGDRVVEMPKNLEQTELRSSQSGFIAYVPMGSLKRGEALVKTGGDGKALPCTLCHGVPLQGMGDAPSIAGRSPSQMARQIIDFQTGARSGGLATLMRPAVEKLTDADIVAITGYLASLKP